MKYNTPGLLIMICLLVGGAAGSVSAERENSSADITVNVQEEKAPVPAELYGIFMEEISHGFDGGIYAELIRNRSFEEGRFPPGMTLVTNENGSLKMELEKLPAGVPEDKWDMPWPWFMNCGWEPNRDLLGWSLEQRGGAKGEMKITEANPLNKANVRSLELTVSGEGDSDAAVAVVNSGYWGINVQEGTPYDLKFYLYPGTFKGKVTATLESGNGAVLARHDFGTVAPGAAWKRLTAKLTATGTDPQARFVLSFSGSGTLQLDWVSMFPPTFKNRPNGLRLDLAQLLEEYKPAFIRYPGGCYVEGLSFETAPDWRTMVCMPELRPGLWGYWKYRSTDGFGYHEFLQFCEDIGADAMYVTFAGMTVHPENNWPLDDIEPVIQRTLDAIEYALGPVTSTWGAVRAKNGHPEPFSLKYVEIGNEHPPALYGDYYVAFRDAIKKKYPDMIVVMSMFFSGLNRGAIERAGDENIDIVDEHAYKGSGWVRTNFDYFDKYKRTPWKVYVGEYASHHAGGDFLAGMDDSLYLMMMERNGDLVTMASYAPLLKNVNAPNWGVNLIEFDSSRSFAHASYYVQKVFNANRPDVNLATTTIVEPQPDAEKPMMSGRIGLGSWNTHNEFKDLKIYDDKGKEIYSDEFKNLDNWETPGRGRWSVRDGVLRQTGTDKGPAVLLLKKPEVSIGKITLKAKRVDGREGFLLLFNAGGEEQFLFCNYGGNGNSFYGIQNRGEADGCSFRGGRTTPGSIETGRWYDVSLVIEKDRAVMYLDGNRVSTARMEYMPSFFATAGYDRKDKSVVLKATNYHGTPVKTRINLEGAAQVAAVGKHIVITSGSVYDQNTLEEPRKIVPREEVLKGCAKQFSITIPPYSVNLIKILVKPQTGN